LLGPQQEEQVGFQEEALDISRAFQQIRDEVVAQYGYDRFSAKSSANSTQDQFTAKTLLQCDSEFMRAHSSHGANMVPQR